MNDSFKEGTEQSPIDAVIVLTLLVLKLGYSVRSLALLFLVIPWTSPGHRKPWIWLWGMFAFLYPVRKNFKNFDQPSTPHQCRELVENANICLWFKKIATTNLNESQLHLTHFSPLWSIWKWVHLPFQIFLAVEYLLRPTNSRRLSTQSQLLWLHVEYKSLLTSTRKVFNDLYVTKFKVGCTTLTFFQSNIHGKK